MLKKYALWFLLVFSLVFNDAECAPTIQIPSSCVGGNTCQFYPEYVLVDGITATPYSSSNPVPVSGTSTISGPLPAGTNIIGKVGIDQTTPGTTNKVSIGTDGTVIANLGTIGAAATAANQSSQLTQETTTATNTGNIPTKGLATAANSTPIVQAKVVITDISSTIATGGTSQTLRTGNASDREIELFNNDATEPLCINPTGGSASLTAAGNICIQPLQYYSNTLNNQTITIIAATTGHIYTSTVRQ
jgi:hypothetical protein